MKNRNKLGKYEKGIIITGIVVLIIFLILLTTDGVKNIGKNNNPIALSEQEKTIVDTPNAPVLSAGMIPVKYEGDNLKICKNDSSWYNYEEGKPAYMMLNDGVYQSELVADMTGKKLASENIGKVIQQNQQGSIYMWMPRYTINTKTEEIKYIEPEATLGGDFEVSDTFMYKQTDEMKPDYSLSGIWVEKTPGDVSKISRMTGEDNSYGFIANTVAVTMTDGDKTAVEEYINHEVGNQGDTVGASIARPSKDYIDNISNPCRTMLKIINDKYHEPIKGKIEYNEKEGTVEITVTYNKYEIAKIEDKNGNAVEFINENGIITATVQAKSGKNHFTVIDNKGNKNELEVTAVLPIYAILYRNESSTTEATLVFTSSNKIIEGKTVVKEYGDISKKVNAYSTLPWGSQSAQITTVDIVDEIAPMQTARWFENCRYLTNIYNINNLDTSNVTSMWRMFHGCLSLTELDLSSLDTRNVKDMSQMFVDCRNLTKVNLSNLDTSNVVDMHEMFEQCYNLQKLDLSNLDTSNLTTMQYMFAYCNRLEELDLSNLDTRSVTSMYGMFQECGSLTELDLSSFNTSNVTNMVNMFVYCTNLKTIYVGENWKVPIGSDNMFHGCGTSTTTLKR